MKRWVVALFVVAVALANDAVAQLNCTNSNDDEAIIEYFNEGNFNQDFIIDIIQSSDTSSFNVQLSCPERESPEFPPSDFYLWMSSLYTSTPVASCDGGTLSFDNSRSAKNLAVCPDWPKCLFNIVLQNKTTGMIYSQTEYQMEIFPGNNTNIPQLEPATLSICNNTLNNCLVDDSCSLSTEKLGSLTLCGSSGSCVSPPNSNSYGYNENNYL